MNTHLQWTPSFNNQFGDRTIYRLFVLGDKIFAVGFEFVATLDELSGKGINIRSVNSTFSLSRKRRLGVILMKLILFC